MRNSASASVGILAAELLLDSCSPNESLLERALSFDAANIDSLTDSDLSKFILVLAQYMVTLKYRENEITVRRIEYGRMVDVLSASAITTRVWKANTPLKQKVLEVSVNDSTIRSTMDKRDQAEAEAAMLSGMVNVFIEYLNAYKREQARRTGYLQTPHPLDRLG